MTFVRYDELTDEERSVIEKVQTVIRDRKVPVSGSDEYLPGQVVEQVDAQIERPFTLHMHTQAWRYYGVRLPNGEDAYRTKSQFCYMNELVGKHVYTPAWVKYLVRKLSDDEIYDAVAAWKPEDAES